MDVGQVTFSVTSDTLKNTLDMAKELQSVLNSIDGSKVKAGVGKAVNNAAKDAEKTANSEDKLIQSRIAEAQKYARLNEKKHKEEIKAQKAESDAYDKLVDKQVKAIRTDFKERERAFKKYQSDRDKEEAKQAKQTQENGKKLMQSWLKEADTEFKQEQSNLHKQYKESEANWKRRIKNIAKENKLRAAVAKEQQAADEKAARVPYEFQKEWQTKLVNAGAQLQTLGNTLVRAASPFENVFRGLTMGIGYRLLGKVTQSIEGAFSRYDTINTYAKVLTEAGVDATKKFSVAGGDAVDVYTNLENAVLGLPTGIDEIIESMRRYATASGDVERATKLAIAANNAYVSGGMGEREKLFTERQLRGLIGGKELTPQQWDSLARNASTALRVVADDMGESVNDMVEKLKAGTISGEEFLDVFIKAGTEGKIAKSAQVLKQTWSSVAANFQNRLNAMGEGILKSLDSVFEEMDGRTFLQHVLGVDKNGNYIGGGIRGVIDNMSKEVQGWIKAHPEKITGFFDNLSKIKWSSLISGFAKFGFTMGRVFAYLGKFVNGNFIRFMLDLGLAGRALGIGGGLLKGTAGITSWILTFAKFGGAGGRIGKAVKAAEKLAKCRAAITGATETVATASLSWQQVASKGLSIAAIPAMAWAMKEVALGLQELDKVNLSWGLVGKIAVAGGAITAFAGLAATMGALTTGHLVGWITTAGTAVGMAEMAGIAKTMKWVGEGLNAIAEAKIPSLSKLNRVMATMDEVSKQFEVKNPLEAFGKIFDSWEKSSEYKAIKYMGEAISSIDEALRVPIKIGWQKRAIKRLGHLFDVVDAIQARFDEEDKNLMKNSESPQAMAKGSKAKKAEKSYTYRKQRLAEFADYAKVLSSGLGDLATSVSNIYQFGQNWDKLKKNSRGTVDWDVIESRIGTLIRSFYRLAVGTNGEASPLQKLREVAQQLKGGNYKKITEALGEIPKMIGKLAGIQSKIASNQGLFHEGRYGSDLSNLSLKLSPLFTAISEISSKIPKVGGLKRLGKIKKALDKVPQVISQLKAMSTNADVGGINVSSIRTAVQKIEEALAELNSLNDKEVNLKITLKGEIDNQAKKQLDDEYDAINKAIKKFDKLPKSKTVRIQINTEINGKDAAIAAASNAIDAIKKAILGMDATISKTVNTSITYGGHGHGVHNGGKIRPIYRARGGSVYNSRGTDTIPAMLTKGEYVINRMAASRIGDAALWKLNHMDIAGALRSLATRAGQGAIPRGGIVNNTTNNTRNIDVDIHNGAGGNIGLCRANRWVRGI